MRAPRPHLIDSARRRDQMLPALSSGGPRDYGDCTPEEVHFLRAVERYQRTRHRRFPTWREVLALIHGLGYRRTAPSEVLP